MHLLYLQVMHILNLAIKYLRELKKKVIIYGVKRSLSNKLKSSANSYVEMPRTNQEQHYYYDAILKSLYILKKTQNGNIL